MRMDGLDPAIQTFYTADYCEDDRLRARAHGVLERVRTQELLGRLLPPPPATVLDVGGGTGVHAEWLAMRGYRVGLVDLVEQHVAIASRIPGVDAEVGDARELSHPDDSQDAVLLLGPLYHLLKRDARLLALQEARRVARPGAPVLAAAISRYAALMEIGTDGRLTEEVEPFLRHLHTTGEFGAGVVGFTACHFHTPQELAQELTAAGLQDVDVFGIEGPAVPTLRALGMDHVEALLPAAVLAARIVERDPALIAASAHLLARSRA